MTLTSLGNLHSERAPLSSLLYPSEQADAEYMLCHAARSHGWESLAWGWLAQLDPDTIWIYGSRENGEPGETSLTRLARRWVPGDLRNEWREAKAKGLVD